VVGVGRSVSTWTESTIHQVPAHERAGTWWRSPLLLYVPALVILVPVFLVPTVLILSMSVTAEPGGFTYYRDIFQSEFIRAVFRRSIFVAGAATVISLLIGLPFAAVALRASPRIRKFLFGAVAASLFFSVIVRAYAWLAMLGHSGPVHGALQGLGIDSADISLVKSTTGIIIGMVQYGVPFMVLSISDVMWRVDDSYEKAAATLGAGPVTRWLRVKLPMVMPGIIAGCTIVFVMTLGYYIIPSILGSPSEIMIGELIGRQVGTTLNWGLGAALASVLLIITLFLVLAVQKLGRIVGRS
jgi:putative spermidine/putrescine transport system permease protein